MMGLLPWKLTKVNDSSLGVKLIVCVCCVYEYGKNLAELVGELDGYKHSPLTNARGNFPILSCEIHPS